MRLLILITLLVILGGCDDDYTPKPHAYPRMDLPNPEFNLPDTSDWNCPFIFEFSSASRIALDPRYRDSLCWYNIHYPNLKATIHLTYNSVKGDLSKHIEQNRKLAMKHISKASSIDEILVENDRDRVYGIVYDFEGETASDMQFFLTDSVNHFLRGALYFNVNPNKDSLAPAIKYVERDISHIIESFRWR